MLTRRRFLSATFGSGLVVFSFGLVGCGRNGETEGNRRGLFDLLGNTVTMYDTNAMALYFDGGLGPETGVIKIDYILKNQPVTLNFWHGHGGKLHQFTITPDHFKEFKKLKKVYVETTEVDHHTHKLFIDFSDVRWRVKGAKPVDVPLDE